MVRSYSNSLEDDALETETERTGYYLTGAIFFAVSGLTFLVMIFLSYDKIKTAVGVLDASAGFLANTKRIFIVPTFYLAIQYFFGIMFM